MKSEAIIPEPLLLDLITTVSFIPQKVDWSSFAWKVLSSWKKTTVLSNTSFDGVCRSLCRLCLALTVGALFSLRKPRPTIFHKNSFHDCTTSSCLWPSMKHPFFANRTSNPSSHNQYRAVSTDIFLGQPGSRVSLLIYPLAEWYSGEICRSLHRSFFSNIFACFGIESFIMPQHTDCW